MYGVCRICFGTDGITICGKCGDELCGECFAKHPCAAQAKREERVSMFTKLEKENSWQHR